MDGVTGQGTLIEVTSDGVHMRLGVHYMGAGDEYKKQKNTLLSVFKEVVDRGRLELPTH